MFSIIGVITASNEAVISVLSNPVNSCISGQLAAAIWAASFPSMRWFLLIVSLMISLVIASFAILSCCSCICLKCFAISICNWSGFMGIWPPWGRGSWVACEGGGIADGNGVIRSLLWILVLSRTCLALCLIGGIEQFSFCSSTIPLLLVSVDGSAFSSLCLTYVLFFLFSGWCNSSLCSCCSSMISSSSSISCSSFLPSSNGEEHNLSDVEDGDFSCCTGWYNLRFLHPLTTEPFCELLLPGSGDEFLKLKAICSNLDDLVGSFPEEDDMPASDEGDLGEALPRSSPSELCTELLPSLVFLWRSIGSSSASVNLFVSSFSSDLGESSDILDPFAACISWIILMRCIKLAATAADSFKSLLLCLVAEKSRGTPPLESNAGSIMRLKLLRNADECWRNRFTWSGWIAPNWFGG